MKPKKNPNPECKTKRSSKYKFDKLDVGQSFRVKADDIRLIRNNATAFTRRHGPRFSVTRTTEATGKCIRVA